jgi:nucleoside-diphosphate-sugar epimerase
MKPNVMIIGGAGYTGTALYQYLEQHNYPVMSIDLEWFGNPGKHHNKIIDMRDLGHTKLLEWPRHIVVLAGHSSVQMCKDNALSAYNNNIYNMLKLLHYIKPGQNVIYASSSSVYGRYQGEYATEQSQFSEPINPYDETKQLLDQITMAHAKESPASVITGLRFGTVNGFSKNLRNDVMINAMTHSAITTGEVNVFNGDTKRSLLGIKDMCRAINTIIQHADKSAVYNLSSIHSTAEDIGKTVASVTGAKLNITATPPQSGNEKLITKNYDFWADSSAFETDFKFTFEDTIKSITKELVTNYNMCTPSPRNREIIYGI